MAYRLLIATEVPANPCLGRFKDQLRFSYPKIRVQSRL